MDGKRAQLVVICPIHNEEQNIDYFFGRLKKTIEQLDPAAYSCRLLFTNNRSTDNSLAIVEVLRKEYPWVGYLTLSRNHGYQLSVLAGISTVPADLYMVCDVDCEDPPEMMIPFVEAIRQGADLAYGIRNNRQEPWWLSRFRSAFYLSLRTVGDYVIVPYMAEFAMFKRCVRDVVVASDNTAPFLRAEFGYAGFNIVGVPYRREARRHGKTHYNFIGNVKFAVAGLLSSTTFPLRAVFYAFPAVCAITLIVVAAFAVDAVSTATAVVALVSLTGTYICAALAFIAVYLARVYHNSLRRARFIIDGARTVLPHEPGVRTRDAGSTARVTPAAPAP